LIVSLVGSVVIDAEFGTKDHSSILCNCDQEGARTTWYQNWTPNQITSYEFISAIHFFFSLFLFLCGSITVWLDKEERAEHKVLKMIQLHTCCDNVIQYSYVITCVYSWITINHIHMRICMVLYWNKYWTYFTYTSWSNFELSEFSFENSRVSNKKRADQSYDYLWDTCDEEKLMWLVAIVKR
jgi:hypothetical protein